MYIYVHIFVNKKLAYSKMTLLWWRFVNRAFLNKCTIIDISFKKTKVKF